MRPVEQLEPRRLLATFTASSVAELISDINAANATGGSNTINLAPGATFKLTAVAVGNDGPTGLPVIRPGNALTIVGNGHTIQRSTGAGTPAFRLFNVAEGGSLSLRNLTLSGGLAPYSGGSIGGAICSGGALSLDGVSIENCTAQGESGYAAGGGAIYSAGVLTVSNSTIQNNRALGGNGYLNPFFFTPEPAGWAAGGGIYIDGGSATLTGTSFFSNLARGGDGISARRHAGGRGGDGSGGAVHVAAGTVEITAATVTRNTAQGGTGGSATKGFAKGADGVGRGGGLYIARAALVSMDSFTRANTRSNSASTSDNDIFGSFSIL